jgi:hypothetical protein
VSPIKLAQLALLLALTGFALTLAAGAAARDFGPDGRLESTW